MSQTMITPDYLFIDQIEAAGSFQITNCYQCRKCTNGCPVTFAMDLYPDEVIRLVLIGQRYEVFTCNTIWVCAACETCTTRCPNDVKIAGLMDRLKEMAVKEGIPAPQSQVLTLHKTFLANVKNWGRLFETTFLPTYSLKSNHMLKIYRGGTLWDEMKLGWQMVRRGRVALFPKKIRGRKEVRKILDNPKERPTVS